MLDVERLDIIEKRLAELEKRLAELEKQIQKQPKLIESNLVKKINEAIASSFRILQG